MIAIKAVGLTKKYNDTLAVDRLNLQIHKGELFALLGVNGAGKSTTVKLLTGLAKPTEGDAFLNGKSICKDTAAVKTMLAVSPQETAVAPGLTVQENLEFMCGVFAIPKQDRVERLAEITRRLGLTSVLQKKAGKLSGGWQRRVSIALALISRPQILFLDEPTLGLDVLARSELWELIRSLKGSVTILLTTHYMEEAEALSDRIGIMKDGRMLLCGTADEIKEKAQADRLEEAFVRIVKEMGS